LLKSSFSSYLESRKRQERYRRIRWRERKGEREREREDKTIMKESLRNTKGGDGNLQHLNSPSTPLTK